MKRILSLFVFLSAALTAGAQSTPPASVWDDPTLLFYVVIGFMFIVVLLVLAVALYLYQVVNTLAQNAAREKAAKD
jgi:ABC-type protease/lipase transport system fused ATPase/permease subunit